MVAVMFAEPAKEGVVFEPPFVLKNKRVVALASQRILALEKIAGCLTE